MHSSMKLIFLFNWKIISNLIKFRNIVDFIIGIILNTILVIKINNVYIYI